MSNPATHLSAYQLEQYAHGRTAAGEMEELERHLAECTDCCHHLETVPPDSFGNLLRGLTDSQSIPGPLLAGYELLEEIGSGGSGVVFRAWHLALQRTVALKRLRTGVLATDEARQRFRREAELLAALRHPHIVQVLDFGEHMGELFLVMELVRGQPLSRMLGQAPLDPRSAAQLMATVARAIQAAHECGVIHRDMKPHNILLPMADDLGGEGRHLVPQQIAIDQVRVVDFGLAKQADSDMTLTRTGALMGTPAYLAPEQLVDPRQGDQRVDVYGLGATLYECLTGRPPFLAPTLWETLQQVGQLSPPPLRQLNPRIPRDLETICLKCLEKDPARRYARAGDLADDLDRFLSERPIQARRASRSRVVWLWLWRHPGLATLTTALCLSIVLGLAGVALHNQRLRAEVRETTLQRNEARRQRERADQNYQRARKALRDILDQAQQHGSGIPRLLELTERQALEAIRFLTDMATVEPADTPEVLRELANLYILLGNTRVQLGRHTAAQDNFAAARSKAEELFRRLPNEENRLLFASTRVKYGIALRADPTQRSFARHEFEEALALLTNADNLLSPSDAVTAKLAWCRHNLGQLELEEENHQQAEQLFAESAEAQLQLAAKRDDFERKRLRASAADSLVNLGLLQAMKGKTLEATETFQQAESMLHDFMAASQEDCRQEKLTLAAAYVNWSNLLLAAGQYAQASELTSRGLRLVEPLHEMEPTHEDIVTRLVSLRGVGAQAHEAAGQFDEAIIDWTAVGQLSLDPTMRSYSQIRVAMVRLQQDRVAEAVQVVNELGTSATPDDRYNSACILARAAVRTIEQGGESPDLAATYRTQAFDILHHLAADGYFEPPRASLLHTDPDLESLRADSRFGSISGPLPAETPAPPAMPDPR